MGFSPSGSSDLFLQWNLYSGDTHGTKVRFLCILPLHDVQLHLPERFHFAFYSVMEN